MKVGKTYCSSPDQQFLESKETLSEERKSKEIYKSHESLEIHKPHPPSLTLQRVYVSVYKKKCKIKCDSGTVQFLFR